MWDSVAARYNTTRERHWPERDRESLRRKFKGLYGMRKTTGNPNIPAHVRLAKDVKKLIDEASSVFLASGGEDGDDGEFVPFVLRARSLAGTGPM
ncbi:hypothetical protein PR003_g25645 [Phytophthora rubi]|uniref:DUF6818 domain-containing protein n=1 Tax=Phytophthora rubi TaxID=129364 RepID=A0A6A3I8V8_9STRA|nr:hypothetical protein PR002_g26061 [Phytophthora rubi]KAE8976738.1 hypothetical protein PR001_g25334 [Phytophthora rubi]KAE9289092.1 hypothetical protein PR003_g25645 [Phytophthora rubi]